MDILLKVISEGTLLLVSAKSLPNNDPVKFEKLCDLVVGNFKKAVSDVQEPW